MTRDLLIRNARIIDGTGAPWFAGSVRVGGGRIAAVGARVATDGADVLEAEGRYLAPGFIDAHCHDDLISLREPERIEKVVQGVTTVVVGNCSFSLYPATPQSRELLRKHFSQLLGETSASEIFESLAAYRDALHRRGTALNVVSLVGHAALRLAVMGYERRPATAHERATMQAMLARELADGAAGLSLGLVYPPSASADHAELAALAETVAAHGKLLAAHIRSYEADLAAAVEEFLGLLAASKAAGLLSHLQSAGRPNWGNVPKILDRLEAARDAGIDVNFDMYPYPAGSSYILQLLPPEAQEGGLDALRQRLGDAEGREALRRAVEDGASDSSRTQSKISLIGWNNVRISGTSNPSLKRLEGKSMDAAAREEGITPFDLMVRCIEEDAGQTAIIMFQLDERDLCAACTHRLHMVGSDGLPRRGTQPHPRAFGTFPRIAGPLTRQSGWFKLEDAVRRMTSIAAQRFSLTDRGLVRPGMQADLVLFDQTITDRATFDRPTELASGVDYVWVAGQPILAGGKAHRPLPGPGARRLNEPGENMRKTITAKNAPRPGGQYSHAIVADGFVYVSGQVPLDPATNSIPEDFGLQVRQALRNLQTILEAAGASLKDVVKVNAYLGEAARFAEYNDVYKEFFAEGPPARTTIGCKLLAGQIEIDCIALLPK